MPKSRSTPRRVPASGPKTARHRELNTKRRGELSELAFADKAAKESFGISTPYGDSERFDFILISRDWPEGEKLWRVQVKSTSTLREGFDQVNAHRRTVGRVTAYKPTEIDFLIAHIIPDDSWFVFPVDVLATVTSPSFRPKKFRRKGIYEPYREAWHLLGSPKP
jgi:hypothetical protein